MAFGLLDSAFALLLEEVAARVTLTGLPPAGQALSLQLLKETLRKNLNLTAFMSPLKKVCFFPATCSIVSHSLLSSFLSELRKIFMSSSTFHQNTLIFRRWRIIAGFLLVLLYFLPLISQTYRSVELFKHPTGIGTFLSLDAGIDMAKANNTGVFDYFSALHTSLISRFRARCSPFLSAHVSIVFHVFFFFEPKVQC
jgi:hypothetical protein